MTPYPRFDGTQHCTQPTPTQRRSFDGQTGPATAQRVCAGCAFLGACHAYSLGHDVTGVWGGCSEDDRRWTRQVRGLPEPVPVTDELDELVLAWRAAHESRSASTNEDDVGPALRSVS